MFVNLLGTYLDVTIRDSQGRYVDSHGAIFQITSLTVVPEPSTALLCVLLGAGTIFCRRVRER